MWRGSISTDRTKEIPNCWCHHSPALACELHVFNENGVQVTTTACRAEPGVVAKERWYTLLASRHG